MSNRQQRRRKPASKTYDKVVIFAEEVRNRWTNQQIYDRFHRPVTQELIDTCAQDMLADIVSVLRARLGDEIGFQAEQVLHEWYDNQDTVNTRKAGE